MIENQENVKSRSDQGYHAVPPPYTWNYIPPKPDLIFIDEQVESDTVETKPVKKNSFSPPIIKDWISDDESEGNPQQKEYKEKRVIDSGCSRHMTGNKCYLIDYKDYNGRFVSFRDGNGKIYGKGKIKTRTLDFDDVYFCKELKYNMFSVSKMCDKKNNVLFTDTECLVISSNFNLLDESQALVRVPRKDNIYSVDLKSVVPTRVVAGFQSNGIAGTKDNIVAGPKDNEVDAGKKAIEVDESQVLDNGGQDDQVTRSEFEGLLQQERHTEHINSTNSFNTVSSLVNTAGLSFVNVASPSPINAVGTPASTNAFEERPFERFSPFKNAFSLPHVPIVTPINDIGIFGNAYDNEVVEEEVDMNNVVSSYIIPDAPLTKFLKDHPKYQVIGSIETHVQTRQMTKINEEHGLISSVQKLRRTNHKDFQNYKWAIGTKLVFKNKKNERGIVIGIGYSEKGQKQSKTEHGIEKRKKVKVKVNPKSPQVKAKDETEEILSGQPVRKLMDQIDEKVYVCQPHGFEDPDFLNKVYKVEKALYGLHQAPRACQDKYVADILKKFDFSIVKTASTSMEPNKALIKDAEAEDVDVHLYRSMIDSLMYLIVSRPDITFAVCACARFQVTLKTSYLHVVKRIFRYLKGQPKLGLWYPRDSPFDLKTYFDSDYPRASLDGKSTIGGCQFLRKRLISWQCKKQTIVANSTTEAEPTILVVDETAYKEWEDIMERATTTDYSLEAVQDNGNINRTQSMATLNEPLS
nr:putative ribonuclease H-like domain-containing protein [Tanacetum cinerariifolium]